MKNLKLIDRPPILFGLAILFLIAASYIPEGITIFGIEVKQVDILEDLQPDEFKEELDEKNVIENSFQSFDNKKQNINFASINYGLDVNFSKKITYFIENEYVKIEKRKAYKAPTFKNHPIEGNLEQLKYFFEALKNSKISQVRIAHYGDSSLEGDLITAYLRNKFQQKYGGNGVGFLPITSKDINFRETTKIKFSDDWITASISGSNPENIPVGIAGKVFLNSEESWVKFEAIPKFRSVRNFDIARIFYSNARNNSSIKYSLDEAAVKSVLLNTGEGIKESIIEDNNSISLKIIFPTEKSAYFYGISLEGKTGVFIDNLPLRGNSGIDLKKIPQHNLKEFNVLLNYKLVIFEFGLNILSGRKTNFKKYEEEMIEVVNEFKKLFTKASFLLIGVHDKCIKKKKSFVTDPLIKKLVQTQKRIAEKTNIAFWNLFEAMGGENSMADWVNANPPLAYTDYIHFNSFGTKEEAEMLFETIMDANR